MWRGFRSRLCYEFLGTKSQLEINLTLKFRGDIFIEGKSFK